MIAIHVAHERFCEGQTTNTILQLASTFTSFEEPVPHYLPCASLVLALFVEQRYEAHIVLMCAPLPFH